MVVVGVNEKEMAADAPAPREKAVGRLFAVAIATDVGAGAAAGGGRLKRNGVDAAGVTFASPAPPSLSGAAIGS